MPTILIVDDERSIVEVLSIVFEDNGYRVLRAGNGREALARLAQAPVDVVLSDLMMPQMDGSELCRQLQAAVAWQAIPVILMSAVAALATHAGCRYAAVLPKPFDLDTLLTTVARVLGAAGGGA